MSGNKTKAGSRSRAIIQLAVILVVIVVAGCLALFGFGKGKMINYLKPWRGHQPWSGSAGRRLYGV